RFSVPLSKLMCCQCLLKQTRIYTFQLSNGSHVCCKRIHPKSSLVTWLITLGLIICPSSYKARPDNLIGLSISSQIFVRRSFLPNGATPDRTSRPKHLWAWLSSSGIQATVSLLYVLHLTGLSDCSMCYLCVYLSLCVFVCVSVCVSPNELLDSAQLWPP